MAPHEPISLQARSIGPPAESDDREAYTHHAVLLHRYLPPLKNVVLVEEKSPQKSTLEQTHRKCCRFRTEPGERILPRPVGALSGGTANLYLW